jgi:hypothetical protein
MITLFRRSAAAAATAVLMTAVGAATTVESAQALSVVYTSWDSGTDVVLTADETTDVRRTGPYAASGICADAITLARQSGLPFSDESAGVCVTWVEICVDEAARNGRAIGAVRFYESRTPRCLVR